MLREQTSKYELEAKIGITEDPNELLAIYRRHSGFFQEIISRLLNLKQYSHFSMVWGEEQPAISKDAASLSQALSTLRNSAKELCQANEAEFLIRTLLELTKAYFATFEAFKICQTVSELVAHNRQFPSKAMAVMHFQIISDLLYRSGNVHSYLKALQILSDLDHTVIKKDELEFLKELAVIKSEAFTKDLFCGIKTKDIDSIVLASNDIEFVPDEKMVFILDAFKQGKCIENTFSNVAFLLKHAIAFVIEDDGLRILGNQSEGFTSVIFNIANRYEPRTKKEVKKTPELRKAVVPKVEKKQEITIKPKVEFTNRFSAAYRRFKLLRMHMPVAFEDVHYNERNARRRAYYEAEAQRAKENQEFLLPYEDVIEKLRGELQVLREEKERKEREILQEKAKAEEQRMKQEQKDSMWRNVAKMQVSAPSIAEIKRSDQISPNTDGIYISKFSTLNFKPENVSKISKQPTSPLRKSEEGDKPPTEKGPWRKKTTKKE